MSTFVLLSALPSTSFWQDPAFLGTIISAAGAIVGVGISIFTWMIQARENSRKALTYQIVSDTPITGIGEGQENSVIISFAGKSLKDARLIVLKIWNSGNVPITPKDYVVPIQIQFKEGEVLASQLLRHRGMEETKLLDKKAPDSVVLPPVLLNPKDLITISTILTGFSGAINIEARLANTKLIVAKNALL